MVAATMGGTTADSSQIVRKNQSYQDYLAAVEENPQLTVEYIEGTIYMTPSPVPKHQLASLNLASMLRVFVKSRKLGTVLIAPLDVELAPQSGIVEPDIIFITRARVGELYGEKRIIGAPDLAVEILSPSTAHLDHTVKLVEYARSGVREYWIVDPQVDSVVIFTLDGDAYRVADAFLTGDVIGVGMFAEAQIAVDEIFAL